MEMEFRVGAWRVHPSRDFIASDEKTVPLEPRVMDLLVHLAEHAGEVAAKDQIEVNRLYERGRYFWDQRTGESLEKARGLFRQVIERDPTHARAHAALANCYILLHYYGGLQAELAYPQARAAAESALVLDDSLAEAHAASGLVCTHYERDWRSAEREFKRAIELNPRDATARQWYGEFLIATGRFDKALDELTLAQELAPLSLIIRATLGWALYCSRRYDEAINQLRATLEMDPGYAVARWVHLPNE